jgi:hypothetical protein
MTGTRDTYGPARERLQGLLGLHALDHLVERSGGRALGPDRIGLRCLGRDYEVSYPDGVVTNAAGEPVDDHLAILLLLYLTEAGGRPLEGRWIGFEQISGGAGYLGSFRGRCMTPFLRVFGPRPEDLLPAAAALDGAPLAMGDAGVTLPALPRVPVAFVVWRGDDEFAPSASIVFDASIEGYLDAEAATVLAELASHDLIAAARSGPSEGVPR